MECKMRLISKGKEPTSLLHHRQQLFADYDNYSKKDDLRKSLVREQYGLCCYCQSRIKPNADDMKIEHWQCQDNYPSRQLDYNNLLGACQGGKGKPENQQHCDTFKRNLELSFCPADPSHNIEARLSFRGDGRIVSQDTEIDRELNEVLNLNTELLVNNRKAVLTAFQQRLQAGKKLDPLKELEKWNDTTNNDLPEFSQVIIFYLKKKLSRCS